MSVYCLVLNLLPLISSNMFDEGDKKCLVFELFNPNILVSVWTC